MFDKTNIITVIGAQLGDEGKGRITDFLARNADFVVRFCGGNNAGHTVINEHGEMRFHIVPVGAMYTGTVNIIGSGAFVHIPTLLSELEDLRKLGISAPTLFISKKAHIVMPWHIMQDELEEAKRNSDSKIGTTKRGMGPVAADKYARKGIRIGDLLDLAALRPRFNNIYAEKEAIIRRIYYYAGFFPFAHKIFEELTGQADQIKDFITDTEPMLWAAVAENKNVLLEGAQAALLDIDYGTYPFCTSSPCGSAQAAHGSGLSPDVIAHGEVIGVVKAYPTRIGSGAFSTRMNSDMDERIRKKGKEYGATTGRPRMCGWIDLPLLQYAAKLSGYTSIAITKLDILSGVKEIKVGIGYECGEHQDCKYYACGLAGKSARYITIPGWRKDLRGVRRFVDLPPNAQKYIELIEGACGAPAHFISVGPARDEIIVREKID